MGDITAIFVVGIIFLAIYKIFEVIIRRKERMMIIDKFEPVSGQELKLPDFNSGLGKFSSLRVGCLLLGIGLGLVVGVLLALNINPAGLITGWTSHGLVELIYVACMMLFGGLGMLISFIIESKSSKKKGE